MDLYPAQVEAANDVSFKIKLLLADVGAGKTAAALSAMRYRYVKSFAPRQRTLVLGTKRICDMVWGPEIKIWAPEHSYMSAAGKSSDERRRIFLDTSIDVVGLNFENLIWAVNEFGSLLPSLFPNLIIDESSKLENPASKTFRAFKPILPLFQWRLPMTGTPRANYLHDLWGSVYLADLGASLGEYKEAFLQNYFVQVDRGGRVAWIPKHDTEARIYERIKDVVHRMPFEWHPPVEQDVLIKLNPTVAKIQKQIDVDIKEEEFVTIDNVTYARFGSRVHNKMLQLSAGFIYDDEGKVVTLHHDKIDALKEIVTEAKGEPMMVVFQFDHERDEILRTFPKARLLDSNEVLNEWNAGKIEMLLVHPRSCGHGLNAQLSQCDLQVWFTPTTDAELYTQTVGRLNRPGNPKVVRVIRLIMQGTKDRAAYLVVAARQRGEDATLESFEYDH